MSQDKWKSAPFLIATTTGVVSERGKIYRGLGVAIRAEGSPKGRIKPKWALTHLGTGHSICQILGDEGFALGIATRIAELGDWSFDSLEGWKNSDPDLAVRVKELFTEYPGVLLRQGTGQVDQTTAREVAAQRE